MKSLKLLLPFLFFTLLSNSIFATISYDGKESRQISYSARKYGLKTAGGTKVYAKLHKPLETLPDGMKVQRIREGLDSDKIAIIGRSIGDPKNGLVGVKDVKKHLKANKVDSEIFNPEQKDWDSFVKAVEDYRARPNVADDAMLPPKEVMKTDLYKANKSWAQKLKDKGYTVLDMGDPNEISEFSSFYAIEKKILFNNGD